MKKLYPILLFLVAFVLISGTIDITNLFNYANQPIPNYINLNDKDNTPNNNAITDAGATLGRVLFYDKNLSANNTIACASCHQQAFAFSDPATLSVGLNGELTGRHSMRLVNTRFAEEVRFFWDERATSLEDQSTQPIQDHVEMGFSGADGDPSLNDLITKLSAIDYYQELFPLAFGDNTITEDRLQRALSQFIRSIQSFDSKYDEGRARVNNNNAPFPNFTAQENLGKTLFSTNPNQNGAGCQACHNAPTFDIDSNSRNNGVVGVAGDPNAIDVTNTRAPSLRDLVNPEGELNGPLMHDGSLTSLMEVINHYNQIVPVPGNNNLDNRLRGGRGGQGQNLQLTQDEKAALEAFLRTLTGKAIYTDERWSDPFDADGTLTIFNGQCATDVALTMSVTSGTQSMEASNTITSTSIISTASVTYQAGTSITLSPGFHAQAGSEFSAVIGDCTTVSSLAENTASTARNATAFTIDTKETISSFTKTAISPLEKLRVYPNPTAYSITISIPTTMNLSNGILLLLDATGQVIQQQRLSSHLMEAQLSNLPAGMYFVKVFDGEQQLISKVLKTD